MVTEVSHKGDTPIPGRCNRVMRDGSFCIMDEGHRGRHSSVGFRCDGCGQMRRSQPFAQAPDDATGETFMYFCFMCSSEQILNPHGMSWGDWN